MVNYITVWHDKMWHSLVKHHPTQHYHIVLDFGPLTNHIHKCSICLMHFKYFLKYASIFESMFVINLINKLHCCMFTLQQLWNWVFKDSIQLWPYYTQCEHKNSPHNLVASLQQFHNNNFYCDNNNRKILCQCSALECLSTHHCQKASLLSAPCQ